MHQYMYMYNNFTNDNNLFCLLPLSHTLSPCGKHLPFPEQRETLNLQQPIEVLVVLQPLVYLQELCFTTIHQSSDSIETEGSVVIRIDFGMDYNSEEHTVES